MRHKNPVSRIRSSLLAAFVAVGLAACGGGGGGGGGGTQTQSIGGGGVKGPLANAIVTAYAFDASAAGFKGSVVDTGTTDASAKITGLALPIPLNPPYILEFTSDAGTTDITTGLAPVITTMRTVLTQALIDGGEDVYSTPLTTMATDLAVSKAGTAAFGGDDTSPVTAAEFVAALPVAALQVTSTLGFGVDNTVDIFDTPPLVDDTTDTTTEQTNVAAYRAAVEAVTAVVYEMDQQNAGTTPDSVLSEITSDLAADGVIDGATEAGTSTVLTATTLAVLDQDPATLPIPNSDDGTGNPILVGEVEQVLIDETATTGTTTNTDELDPATGSIDTVVAPAEKDPDLDDDGVLNTDDAYPSDATADTDTDGDGAPDVAYTDAGRGTIDTARSDADDDNDGWLDIEDDYPTNASAFLDPAQDRDNDGVDNGTDNCPLTSNPDQADTDGNGQGDACSNDNDGDGVDDGVDNCPLVANPSQTNIDSGTGDTLGDVCDDDIDGDTVLNAADKFPLDATESADNDGDGIGDTADLDDDNDGISDVDEGANGTDPTKRDSDGDGVFDNADAFPNNSNESIDTDGDCGVTPQYGATDGDTCGNNTDTDDDGDGVSDTAEIAAGTKPLIADTDGDGANDGADDFPLDATETVDTDGDGVGDNGDAFPNDATETTDSDGDGIGDNAETAAGTNPNSVDTDSDTVNDPVDNCPVTANTGQADQDTDGVGDACDADRDGDGHDNSVDAFPDNILEWADNDGDGVGNNSDVCPDDATNSCPATMGLDMSGVQRLTATAQTAAAVGGGSCSQEDIDAAAANAQESFYVTTDQATRTGTSAVSMRTVWGDNLSGTVDTNVPGGDYSLTGTTTFTDPFGVEPDESDAITVTGNALTGTGSISIIQSVGGVDQCTVTYSYTVAQVYRHDGTEDYNGVYGLELNDDNDERSSFAIQIEVSGATMSIHLPFNDPNETFTNTSFDPNTGFFSFDIDGVSDYDDGTGSEEWHDKLTGILINAPDAAGGVPSVALRIDGRSAEFNNLGGSAGGSPVYTDWSEERAYGKRLSSTGFTRNSHYRKSADGKEYDGVVIGMSHPPLKLATATSELYVEVLDSDGTTRLCTGPYSGRYVNADYRPAVGETGVDFAAEQFQSQWYSFASCNTSTNTGGVSTHNVADGDVVTVRIMDTGADGMVDGGDDTAVAGASMTYNVELNTAAFTELPNVHDFALNGAKPSQTMKQGREDGVIELFGFFDINEDMAFTWTGLAAMGATDIYSLQVKESKADLGQIRFTNSSPNGGAATESIAIPAGTLDDWDGNVIRIRARQDGTTSNHRAISTSKYVVVEPGIRGLFNVELGGAVTGLHDTFQLWLEGDMGDGMSSTLNECVVTNNQFWTCSGGSIDYSTNTVSLNMTDNTGTYTAVTLDLNFSDSANATVSTASASVTAINGATTHVRMVNPEMGVRTLQPSNGVAQQSLVTIGNMFGEGDLASGNSFDKAVFKRNDDGNFLVNGGATDTGVAAKAFWNDTVADGAPKPAANEVEVYSVVPTDDGVAQRVGRYMFNRTNSDWGLNPGAPAVLDAGKYKVVWSNADDANLKFVFKTNYAALDASALVTPLLTDVTVNLSGGDVTGVRAAANGGDVNNPIDVSSDPNVPLTWTGSTVAGGEWQIRLIFVSSTNGVPAGTEFRSPWLTDADPTLTDVGGLGTTWSWSDPVGLGLLPGDVVKVQIRTRDAANTMLGAQRMGGAVEDVIYLKVL